MGKGIFSKVWAILFFAILLLTSACAQSLKLIEKQNKQHHLYEVKTKRDEVHSLKFQDSFTSVVLELTNSENFNGVMLIDQGDTLEVDKAQHGKTDGQVLKSELTMMKEKTDQFQLLTKDGGKKLIIHLLDASQESGSLGKQRQSKLTSGQCAKPPMVQQAEWREGLDKPDYDPIKHEVRHLIVHHSAGNTQNNDTRSVVRNIYTYHTQVNGWSDIGYNFLIGIDGKIFKGRDGLGEVPTHKVKGAHFCGKNANTIGVCLIGDYENNNPKMAALERLKQLLIWKSHKAFLDPLAYYQHPDYADSPNYLGVMAGHKDGCSTLCPGKNLYAKLNGIKHLVKDSIDRCSRNVTKANMGDEIDDWSVRYQQGDLVIANSKVKGPAQLEFYNIRGKVIGTARNLDLSQGSVHYPVNPSIKPGVYLARIKMDNRVEYTHKVLIK